MPVFKRLTALLLILALSLSTLIPPTLAESTQSPANEMRGLWVASVVNIDYPSKPTTNSETLKNEAIAVLDKAQQAGLNAVFLQVRPTADALYASQYFPWSKYLTGSQGLQPDNGFDPLAFWVEESHKRGIELHAWINPYRITKKLSKEPSHDFASLTPDHPANQHPEWVVKHSDGNLYFNPGIPAVRQYIIDSSLEIVKNYSVDGIHFDDYFYPGQTFADSETFKTYGTGFSSIHDWRRENVTLLVEGLSKAIKTTGKKVSFGISPFGIWANKAKNPLGSDTSGLQSYYDHYADTRKWVKDGSIDYIAPQLYWNIGFKVADYVKLLSWWQNVVSGTHVKLYVGHAAYRTGNTNAESPWYGVDEITRQLKLNASTPEVSGSIFYNYSALKKSKKLVDLLSQYYNNQPDFITRPDSTVIQTPSTPVDSIQPKQNITIASPSNNTKTSSANYYISGTSDPTVPLYVNGKLVDGRSSKGYFGYYAALNKGTNTFTFKQGNNQKSIKIVRVTAGSGSGTGTAVKTADIPQSSTFPQSEEMRSAGDTVTLSCKAPIGSTVTVQLDGTVYNMIPTQTKTNQRGIVLTTYTYKFILPLFNDDTAPVNLGKPIYTMAYNGRSITKTAPADLSVIAPDTQFYAVVKEDVIETYSSATTSNGSNSEIYKDMVDKITAVSGSFVCLNSGVWVKKEKVRFVGSEYTFSPDVTSVQYTTGEKWDQIRFGFSQKPVAAMRFDGKTLTLTTSASDEAMGIDSNAQVLLPPDSLFESAKTEVMNHKRIYSLKVKDGQSLTGYMITPNSTGFSLDVKRKPVVINPSRPLEGITILLDPGHGGSDPGALGPLGTQYSEEHINLALSLKLERVLSDLGATIKMTRRTDEKVSLTDRLAMSRQIRPDLFISVHANSIDPSVNINNVKGFSVYYNNTGVSKTISTLVQKQVIANLGRKDRGANVMNFYVTKSSWAPSLLLETGFVPNPLEFEWLTDETSVDTLANQLAQSIVTYFSQP